MSQSKAYKLLIGSLITCLRLRRSDAAQEIKLNYPSIHTCIIKHKGLILWKQQKHSKGDSMDYEPSSVALFKPATKARLLYCNLENLHERHIPKRGQIIQTLLRSMFLNMSVLKTLNIFTDLKGPK